MGRWILDKKTGNMRDEITGAEITKDDNCLFIDYNNWNSKVFHKDMTLERVNELTSLNYTKMPKMILINKPKQDE